MKTTLQKKAIFLAPRCKRNYNLFPNYRADALHPEYDRWFVQFDQTNKHGGLDYCEEIPPGGIMLVYATGY